jgi:hypothetical protein
VKTIHLHAGTGLRFVTCLSSELSDSYNKPQFQIDTFGWGTRGPKKEGDQGFRTRLVFDTRYIDNLGQSGERIIPIGPNMRVVVHPVSPPVDAALVVDLGNTRSFGLVLDDSGHADSMRIYPLQIRAYSDWTDQQTKAGVFSSHVCLEHIPTCGHPEASSSEGRFGHPLSVVRTGHAATLLTQQVSAGVVQSPNGRVSQVSPKRLFWDHDPVRFKWRAVCVDNQKCVKPEGILYDAWLKAKDIAPESMPQSTLLGAMVVEMYSQAEMQLNEFVSGTDRAAVGPRRIRRIAITYPPAWSKLEIDAYCTTIRDKVAAYCVERGLPTPQIFVTCDEATGTLLAYISNEVEKFGGHLAEWVASIGTLDSTGDSCARIAVLDVGGGTSDLVIAEVRVMVGRFGSQHLAVNRFYLDGVLVAGDELLRRVATRIVLPAVASAICPEDNVARKTFLTHLISQQTGDESLRQKRARWAQQLWYPMALQVVQQWQKGEPAVLPQDLNAELILFCRDCLDALPAFPFERMVFVGLGTQDKPDTGLIRERLESLAPDQELIQTLSDEVFADAAVRFGIPITLARCDRVLLSGKTTEFKFVRHVLTQHIPLPACKIVSFENYRLADRWVASAGRDGTNLLDDVKMTTVIGAALELCVHQGIAVFGLIHELVMADAPLLSDAQQYWGVVPATAVVPSFTNRNAVFRPDETEQVARIPIHSQSLLFARRRTANERMTALIAYELRVKPGVSGTPSGTVVVERTTDADGLAKLRFVDVEPGGVLCRTTGAPEPLKRGHFEWRQMVAQNADFWIAEGNLHEDIHW